MSDELWKSIPGYEGKYEVSNKGKVRSIDHFANDGHLYKGRVLKIHKDNQGYCRVWLYHNRKTKPHLVHRLVALTFMPNINNLPEVNHKDENKSNNSVTNLEWCNSKYNSNYGMRKDKVSKALKGRVFTETWKKNSSLAHLGFKPSDETRQKMSESHKGKKFTDEHKRKISEKRIAFWKLKKEELNNEENTIKKVD